MYTCLLPFACNVPHLIVTVVDLHCFLKSYYTSTVTDIRVLFLNALHNVMYVVLLIAECICTVIMNDLRF